MNEHGFVKAVHRHLCPDVYRWKIHDTYTGGVPDTFYCGPAGPLWVEYKYIKLPKRPTTPINLGLSELQRAWLQRMLDWDQPAAVVVGFDKSATIITDLEDRACLVLADLKENAVTFKRVAAWIREITYASS